MSDSLEENRFSTSPQQGPPRMNAQVTMLAWAVFLLALLAVVQLFFNRGRGWLGTSGEPAAIAPRGDLAADEQATIALFQNASHSVVYITTSNVARTFRAQIEETPQGTGSGFVWDDQGHIVTNFHVIDDANRCRVTLADQSVWNATVVGAAPDRDIAVIKIDAPAEKLRPLIVGTSNDLQVGQKVFAIGNPFGLDQTLTTGIISGLGREIQARTGRKIDGVIQTDAAINPGNSGGPLLDSSGRLIGVNTAIFSPSGASAGIGFAIPVASVARTVTRLIRDGRIVRPGLGLSYAPDAVMKRQGLPGVLILGVLPGGAADKAGLKPTTEDEDGIHLGDIIVSLDGQPIRDSDALLAALEEHEVGQQSKITVMRGASTPEAHEVTVTVTFQNAVN